MRRKCGPIPQDLVSLSLVPLFISMWKETGLEGSTLKTAKQAGSSRRDFSTPWQSLCLGNPCIVYGIIITIVGTKSRAHDETRMKIEASFCTTWPLEFVLQRGSTVEDLRPSL